MSVTQSRDGWCEDLSSTGITAGIAWPELFVSCAIVFCKNSVELPRTAFKKEASWLQ